MTRNGDGVALRIVPENLAMLEQLRQQMQRHRIQMGNRYGAVEDGRSTMNTELIDHFSARFQLLEDELTGMITSAVQDHELWPWLKECKGIGPTLAGAMLAHIDIAEPTCVSGLWRYAGQGVDNRTQLRDRPTKGEKLPYNAELKRILYIVEGSFMRAGSPYRREYDSKRAFYEEHRDEWTKAHIDQAAKRAMVKLFLEHMFTVWRDLRRLPIMPPYAISELKHFHVKPPWEYVPGYEYPATVRQHYEMQGRLAQASK